MNREQASDHNISCLINTTRNRLYQQLAGPPSMNPVGNSNKAAEEQSTDVHHLEDMSTVKKGQV